jgi:hypothetical protein
MMTLNNINTSAKVAAIVGDETGTGAMCFATLPTFQTGINILGYSSSTSITVNDRFKVNSDGSATTTNSFYVGTGQIRDISNKSLTIASSTLIYLGGATSTVQFISGEYPETWTKVACATDVGTATIELTDGTDNVLGYVECSTSAASLVLSSNNTFTAFEGIKVLVGKRTTNPNFIMLSISRKYN